VWEKASEGDAGAPPLQRLSAIFYPPEHGIVMFGGWDDSAYQRRTALWAWNGTEWSQLCKLAPCVATRPPVRESAGFAYDSARKRMVVFGGLGTDVLQDTWGFDGTSWAEACTTVPCSTIMPPTRQRPGMAFDTNRSRIVLYGGYDPRDPTPCLGDSWEWDGTDLWSVMYEYLQQCSPGKPPAPAMQRASCSRTDGSPITSGWRARRAT